MASRREHRGRQKRPSRGQRRATARRASPRARARDRPPVQAHGAGDGRRPRRSDQLRQDARRARVPRRDRPRRLRGAAADARPGGASAPRRPARRRARRPRHGRGARQRARADHLLHGGDGAALRARCSCSTRCSGPTTPSAARPGRGCCSPASTGTSSCSARSRRCRSSQNAFPEAEIRFFERKAPLDWTGAVSFQSLQPGTVVVAFSRRAVLALAGELNRRQPGKVAVLYGAMPLASRRLEIDRFMNGAGDGLLRHRRARPRRQPPLRDAALRRVAEVRRRGAARPARVGDRADRRPRGPLRPRRARPRRRAHRDRLGERRPGADRGGARTRHVPLPGGHLGYRVVDTARIRPRLEDLPIESPAQLPAALRAWHTAALRQWATDGWLSVESIGPLLVRLDAVQRRLRERGRRLSLEQVWKLVNAPVDEDNVELLGTLALAVAGDRAPRPVLQWLLDVEPAPRRLARGRRAGCADGEHPPLVRTPVPGRRRGDAREGGRAGGGRRRAASARSSRPR